MDVESGVRRSGVVVERVYLGRPVPKEVSEELHRHGVRKCERAEECRQRQDGPEGGPFLLDKRRVYVPEQDVPGDWVQEHTIYVPPL